MFFRFAHLFAFSEVTLSRIEPSDKHLYPYIFVKKKRRIYLLRIWYKYVLIPSIELQTELHTDSLARKSAKMLKSA